jgi:cytochrome b561
MAGLASLDLRYSRTAIALHWVIATLILVNLTLGIIHDSFPKPVSATMIFYHKAIGITVLALTLLRLGWRLIHRPPPFDPAMKKWERGLARTVHWLFYVLLVAIPTTGWLLTSSGGRATSWFGLFSIPALPVSRSDDAHDTFQALHQYLAYSVIALLLLHVAGALRHHLKGHGRIIGRMAPWFYRGAESPARQGALRQFEIR